MLLDILRRENILPNNNNNNVIPTEHMIFKDRHTKTKKTNTVQKFLSKCDRSIAFEELKDLEKLGCEVNLDDSGLQLYF